MSKYQCPTCESRDVDAFEFEIEDSVCSERVHIYCNNLDCGWLHRGLSQRGRKVRV